MALSDSSSPTLITLTPPIGVRVRVTRSSEAPTEHADHGPADDLEADIERLIAQRRARQRTAWT